MRTVANHEYLHLPHRACICFTLYMPNQPLKIWCNLRFPAKADELLRAGVQPHQFFLADHLQDCNLANGAPDPRLATANVVFGQIDPAAVLQTPSIQWIHLTTAGYERYDRAEFLEELRRRGTILTNSSDVYSEPCAEHLLAMMLSFSRRLPEAMQNQQTLRGWPAAELRSRSSLLAGQTVLLLGYGHIARRFCELLAPFEAQILIIRRTVSGSEAAPTYPQPKLQELLPTADHLANLLPGGPATLNFISTPQLALMKPSAFYYTIGRGTTTDQQALVAALQSGQIAAAYVDVTDPEPLPPDHPLWTTPNCYITPDTAGGQVAEPFRVVEHFLENLRRFTNRQPMKNRIV